jgi:hypothetical protein
MPIAPMHALAMHGPHADAPQSAFVVHDSVLHVPPLDGSAKYWMPNDMPVKPGCCKNESSAPVTADHFVPPGTLSLIEPD